MGSTGHDAAALNERLAVLIAGGKTSAQAARELGVSEATVRRRRALPEVRARILALSEQITSSATELLAREMTASIATLAELRDLPAAESTRWVRLQAATTLVNLGLRAAPNDDAAKLGERLAEVLGAWRAPPPEPTDEGTPAPAG